MLLSLDINKSDIFWLFISQAIFILLQSAFHELAQITFGLLQSCRERCQTFDITQHCIYLQGKTKLLILSLKVKMKSYHFLINIEPFILIYLSLLLKNFMMMYVSWSLGVTQKELMHLEVCIIHPLDGLLFTIDYELLKLTWRIEKHWYKLWL